MSEKLILQKLKFYYDYLKLRHMFPEEFEEKFGGKKGAAEEVNRILDQIIFLNRELEKIRKEKNNE